MLNMDRNWANYSYDDKFIIVLILLFMYYFFNFI